MFDLTLSAVSNNFKGELPALRPITITSLLLVHCLYFLFQLCFFSRKNADPIAFFFQEPTATFNQIKHDSVLVLVIDSEDQGKKNCFFGPIFGEKSVFGWVGNDFGKKKSEKNRRFSEKNRFFSEKN